MAVKTAQITDNKLMDELINDIIADGIGKISSLVPILAILGPIF